MFLNPCPFENKRVNGRSFLFTLAQIKMTQILLSRYVKRVKSGEMNWSVADIVMETWPQSQTLSSMTNAPLPLVAVFNIVCQ